LRAWLTDILIQQVLENRTTSLKAIGADVSKVVRYGGHLGLLRIQSGFRDP
jgi:hypothetical protein